MWSAGSQALCGGNVNIAAALPVPHIRIADAPADSQVFMPEDRASGPTVGVTLHSRLECVALDIPMTFFQPQYGLQVELLRYARAPAGRTWTGTPSRRPKYHSTWVHPSHGPYFGHDQRGGAHYDASGVPLDMSIRPSEWPVTARNQVIDLSQGAAGRCLYVPAGRAEYFAPPGVAATNLRDIIGNPDRQYERYAAQGKGRGRPGIWTAPKFAFRYSIVDPDDPRGGRISGPMSQVIMAGMSRPALYKYFPSSVAGSGYQWEWNHGYPGAALHFFFARRLST